jgi:hypothetical protein
MSSASENAPTTSNVFTFIGFSLVVSLDSQRFHRERSHAANMVPTAHPWRCPYSHSGRTTPRVAKKLASAAGMELSNEPAAETWLVERSRLDDTAQIQMLAHRAGHALS